jgi:putative transferase (TIGR04331 family)
MEKCLVTTALNIKINKTINKKLYLGEWCNLYGGSESARLPTLPYHWDDRLKIVNDFEYLRELRCRLIPLLATELNSIHNSHYSDRAWHLILGYWLNQFITVSFDRWSMLDVATKSNNNLVSFLENYDWRQLIPRDTNEAGVQFTDDQWNHVFIGQLMESREDIRVVKNSPLASCSYLGKRKHTKQKKNQFIKQKIRGFLYWLLCRHSFLSDKCYVLASSSLSLQNMIRLRTALAGSIHYEPNFSEVPKVSCNEKMRCWLIPDYESDDQFVRIVKKLLPKWMPTSFIEGFSEIQSSINNGDFPNSVDVIFTSYKHLNDDTFKYWAATELDKDCKLVIGQHGGGPFHKVNGGCQFEREIADFYVTTGCGNRGFDHLHDVGQFWNRLVNVKWDPEGVALVTMVGMPRYTFDLRSMALAGQMIEYFEDQFTFYKEVGTNIQQQTVIRLTNIESDYGWKIRERWLDRFPSVQLDHGVVPIKKLITKSRLCICTYNCTVYNETLGCNIPTVMYWNKNIWEAAEWADADFDILKSVGIYHDSPESAAKHVKAVWNDVNRWWMDSKVQAARKTFCRKYAYHHSSVIPKLANVLCGVAENR